MRKLLCCTLVFDSILRLMLESWSLKIGRPNFGLINFLHFESFHRLKIIILFLLGMESTRFNYININCHMKYIIYF